MLQSNAHFLIIALWSYESSMLKLETVKASITTKTHFAHLSFIQFYKLILNKKNFVEEIHSSHKYPIKVEQSSSKSWEE
jgi:hypothetical protein